MRRLPLAALAAATLALTACAPQEEGSDATASGSSAAGSSASEECSPGSLETLEPDTLTIATDEPAYEPWVVGDDPESGEKLIQELRAHVRKDIGPIAKPKKIMLTPELPKTRSGKIMRRLLVDIAERRELGDVTTLADPAVVTQIDETMGKLAAGS